MMQVSMTILCIFAIFQIASCRPSDLTPHTITRDVKPDLPGSERINKRSAEDIMELSTAVLTDIPSDDDDESEDDDDYSADYPIYSSSPDEIKSLASNEDFEVAESNIVFHPLFASRKLSLNKNRASRSLDEVQDHKIALSKDKKESDDDLEVSGNGMVFLPLFRSETRLTEKLRLRRSLESVSKTTKTKDVVDIDDKLDDDTVYQSNLKRKPRPVRSIPEIGLLRNGDVLVDDMAYAENGLIFRPLFRNRQRSPESA